MISVIVPVHNERDNIRPLLQEITQAAQSVPIGEILYVDDASTDDTLDVLKSARDEFPLLRIVSHSVCGGQSAALMTGVRAATQELVVTIDGDGQNDPKGIVKLYETYQAHEKNHEKLMVAGQREKRHDNVIRRISSRLANAIRSGFLRDKTKDTGCSLKLIRREDYIKLPYFNHMHRFLPALLMRDHVHIAHVMVSHRPRTAGVSKYGFWNRLWVGIVDLLGVRWLLMRATPEKLKTKEIL